MRKLWVALSVLVFSLSVMSTYALSQEVENLASEHQDSDRTVQAGFAVITASSTSASSDMVAFGTFGLRQILGTNQAGVLPSSLSTNALLFVDINGRLARNLGVAIVNPNASPVNVTLTIRKGDGTQLASTTITVPAVQQVSKFVTELFANQPAVPRDLTGTLSITSTSPVSVIGLRFRGFAFSSLPATNLSTPAPVPTIATGIGGAGSILLPQFAAGGGWGTEIVIVNHGTSSLTVRVDLFKADGTALKTTLNGTTASSFTDIVIPAGGVFVLAPHDDDDPR